MLTYTLMLTGLLALLSCFSTRLFVCSLIQYSPSWVKVLKLFQYTIICMLTYTPNFLNYKGSPLQVSVHDYLYAHLYKSDGPGFTTLQKFQYTIICMLTYTNLEEFAKLAPQFQYMIFCMLTYTPSSKKTGLSLLSFST